MGSTLMPPLAFSTCNCDKGITFFRFGLVRTVTTLCLAFALKDVVFVSGVNCIGALEFVVTILNLSMFFTAMFFTNGMVRVLCSMLGVAIVCGFETTISFCPVEVVTVFVVTGFRGAHTLIVLWISPLVLAFVVVMCFKVMCCGSLLGVATVFGFSITLFVSGSCSFASNSSIVVLVDIEFELIVLGSFVSEVGDNTGGFGCSFGEQTICCC